jgi:Lrp/AsnC family leucine-responsive transcriptional regulator
MQIEAIGTIEGKLDEKDWILLELLQEDARTSFAELGRRAGLSAPAAAERVRRFEDLGLITGYHAEVDPKRLGLAIPVMVEVQVSRADYARFQKAVKNLPCVQECQHVTGRAAYALRAVVPAVEDLEGLIGQLSQFGQTTTSLVLSTVLARRIFRREAGGKAAPRRG